MNTRRRSAQRGTLAKSAKYKDNANHSHLFAGGSVLDLPANAVPELTSTTPAGKPDFALLIPVRGAFFITRKRS